MKKVKYPSGVNDNQKKIEYLYNVEEALRVQHNAKGKDFKDGVISKQEWEDYKKNEFEAKREHIINDMVKAKTAMQKSKKHNIDLDDIIEDA